MFEVPKMNFVYAASLWSLAWFGVYGSYHRFKRQTTPLDLGLVLLLVSAIISTTLSMHPYTSIYGYPSRLHGSLLSTLSYLSLTWIGMQIATTNFKHQAMRFAAAGVILAAVYAVPEHFGGSFSCLFVSGNFEATCWVQDVVTRIFGSFGQPNWLGVYMVLGLPILWSLSLSYVHKPAKFWLMAFAGCVAMMALIFTKSRSAMLGIMATTTLSSLGLLYAYFKEKHRRYLQTLTIIGISVVVPAILFGTVFSPGIVSQGPRAVGDLSTSVGSLLERDEVSLAPMSQGGTESGTIRQIVWQGAWNVFLSSPLFGTGVDTFAYSYYQHRPLAHNLVSEWDFLYNRAHNEHLNILATTGILGMVAYLVWWGSMTLVASSRFFRTPSTDTTATLIVVMGVVGVQITHFFGFSTVAVSVVSMVVPAILLTKASTFPTRTNPKWEYIGIGLISLLLAVHLGRVYLADLAYARADALDASGEYQLASSPYEAAMRLHPRDARFSADLADNYAKRAIIASLSGQATAAAQLAIDAGAFSEQTLRNNPWHLNFYKSQAGVFIRLSQLSPDFLPVAQSILTQATTLAPTDAKLSYNLGLLAEDLGQSDAALTWHLTAIEQKPNYAEAYLQAIPLAKSLDQLDLAMDLAETLTTHVSPDQDWANALKTDLEAYQATAAARSVK